MSKSAPSMTAAPLSMRRHENIVPWAVDEGHVPHERHLLVLEPGTVHAGESVIVLPYAR
jgi:hypothetical protein